MGGFCYILWISFWDGYIPLFKVDNQLFYSMGDFFVGIKQPLNRLNDSSSYFCDLETRKNPMNWDCFTCNPIVDPNGYATFINKFSNSVTVFRVMMEATNNTLEKNPLQVPEAPGCTTQPSLNDQQPNRNFELILIVSLLVGSAALLLACIKKCCSGSQKPVGVAYSPLTQQENKGVEFRNPLNFNKVVPID